MNVRMGDVRLELLTEGVPVGFTILPNLNLMSGDNLVTGLTTFQPNLADPAAVAVGRKMVSNYLNGIDNPIQILGTLDRSTNVSIVSQSLSFLNLSAPMPGIQQPLVRESELKISPGTPFNERAKARFQIVNPFAAPFTIYSIKAEINGPRSMGRIGEMNVRLNGTEGDLKPFELEAGQTLKTPYYPLQLKVNLETIDLAKAGIFSTFNVQAKTEIDCAVGDYNLTVDYVQNRVPTSLEFL